jgi:hypothetical protein
MSNAIYGKAKQAILNGQINVSSQTLKVLLVESSYSFSQNIHEFVSDISPSSIKARSGALINVQNSLGVLDADDITFINYPGYAFKAAILYVDSGSDSTSRLIAYIDTATGIPFEGINTQLNITIVWSNDSSKIISL